jgi:hypothetical protein
MSELRDETDSDPLVEQATDRLRAALTALDARDEWGRALAWRQVARIAIGPLLVELRDAQTAARLSAATDTGVPLRTPGLLDADLFVAPRDPEPDRPRFDTA